MLRSHVVVGRSSFRSMLSAVPMAALLVSSGASASTATRSLSFEDRVRAAKVIERIRQGHRTGAAAALELPTGAIEARVRTSLQQSLVLERVWNEPLGAAALRRETERVLRSTRSPARLRELIDALGGDPILVQECLVRPALVDRLARAHFASDARIHEAARLRAEALHSRLLTGGAMGGASPLTVEIALEGRYVPAADQRPGTVRQRLGEDAFRSTRASLPGGRGGVSSVRETRDAFLVDVLVDEAPGRLELQRWTVAKRTWEEWWAGVAAELDPHDAATVAVGEVDLDLVPEAGPCLPDDTWNNGSLDDVPPERGSHTAVWTGTEMIVWGGTGLWGEYLPLGSRYDPALDVWMATSGVGAPAVRTQHTAVWTGTQMIVWGGQGPGGRLGNGGRYDPVTDTWLPISDMGAPAPRTDASMIWTGSRAIVWGGMGDVRLQTGGIYDPVADTWAPTTVVGAPSARRQHTAVWTGTEMVVWGGQTGGQFTVTYTNTGGRYDPVADRWSETRTLHAPLPRAQHTAVWTGGEVILWGGRNASAYLSDGARYDAQRDRWSSMSLAGAPASRVSHGAVWTGSEMIVWGGELASGLEDATGGRYRPGTDTWAPMTAAGAPSARELHTAVWTGTRMIAWGGFPGPVVTGGSYDPATDAWTATSEGSAAPSRQQHTAIWTGSEMIVWGGWGGAYLSSGDRYDPALDHWTATSTAGAPSGRNGHSAVWTGTHMIVWGGGSATATPRGARYDPVLDQWSAISEQDAPDARYNHAAVWTGREMIVWGGGLFAGGWTNSGGRYDPATDRWRPTILTAAPPPRTSPAGVWTGVEMVVWGGLGNFGYEHTGGRYDPRLDRWSAMTGLNAPQGRVGHSAVWTGTEMIVWGGTINFDWPIRVGDGRRYDPVLDTWSNMSGTGLVPRDNHAAVWTGRDMIVWDGDTDIAHDGTGVRYDARTDTWTDVSIGSAPSGRSLHTAVWTGAEMIVWGGDEGPRLARTGGRYAADSDDDGQGDGCDNCLADVNPGQADADGDGFGDTCDLCPDVVDLFQGDLDRDGIGDTCDADRDGDSVPNEADCAPDHPSAHTPVGEVSGVVVDRADTVFLLWPSQGDGITYDIAGGVLSVLRVDGHIGAAECLAWLLSGTQWSDAREGPEPGEGWYYLVRAANPCGPGTYGYATGGTERINTACP